MLKRNSSLLLLLFLTLKFNAQFYYGHQMDFGKNRIQRQNFIWTYLDYDKYRVYNYQGGIELAKYVSVSTDKILSVLEKRLDYSLQDKLNIIVYNNQTDFKQSNIGLSIAEQSNTGGVTKIIGDKLFVYFNGSHADLDKQLRAAIAELFINQILYGGNIGEMWRNSTLLNVPDWYTKGLVKYLSEGWTSYSDNLLYDAVKNDHYSQFNKLTGNQAINAGYGLWYYIVDTNGETSIKDLLHMTRATRNPDNALLFVLGINLNNLIYDFNDSFNRRLFAYKDSTRKSPINNNSVLKKYKPTRHYYQVKVSPDGKQVVYARTELNQLRVYLKDLETGKQKRLLKYGPKVEMIEDYNYPLLAWNPKGNLIAMVYDYKDQLVLTLNDIETKEKITKNFTGFEKINSISYSPDGKKLAISAVKKSKGQSDIFVYSINSGGVEQLTNDIWDDNNPVFVKGNKQIIFESNRELDTIKPKDDANYFVKIQRNMDLFMAPYPFTSKVLVRVTNTPDVNETLPQSYNKEIVTYLADNNGIYNRYIATFDSTISFVDTTEHYRYFFKSEPITNYDRNILEQNINFLGTHVSELIFANGKDMMLVSPLPKYNINSKISTPKNTWFKTSVRPVITDPTNFKDIKEPVEEINKVERTEKNSNGIDFDNYSFKNENKPQENTTSENKINKLTTSNNDTLVNLKPNNKQKSLQFPTQKNYYTSFYTDYIVNQLDNSFLNNNYQFFNPSGSPIFLNPGFNIMNKIGISDLFEDHRIIGGYRFNFNFDNEFMLQYEYRKKLIDHEFVLGRQTFRRVPLYSNLVNGYYGKSNTHTARYSMKIPFNEVSAIKLSALYRNDRLVLLSNNDLFLPIPNLYQNMVGTKAEYVFDNTRSIMLNILNGFRFKAFAEYWKFLETNGEDFFAAGFDARHYLKVSRQITWCNRIAGGTSAGTQKLIYYLGGVDNWLLPSFNNNINIVRPEQYGFQTLATNMRGFTQNIRNGNNFLVINSELRIPIVRYLFSTPFRSEFLNNFQLIGFGDIGMAWTGINPLSNDNTKNIQTYYQQGTNIILEISNPRSPLVAGTGFGVRSKLFGYFVRLDFGWGIDELKVSDKAQIHLSLATDF